MVYSTPELQLVGATHNLVLGTTKNPLENVEAIGSYQFDNELPPEDAW